MRVDAPIVLFAFACLLLTGADSPQKAPAKKASDEKAQLAELQAYVGSWRGAGQVRRGSTRGAWTEQADWAWRFSEDSAALVLVSPDAKYFQRAELQSAGDGEYQLTATSSDDAAIIYRGSRDEAGKVVLVAAEPKEGLPARITIRLVAEGKRMVVLYERSAGDRFARLSEVGYTRKGSRFGKGTSYVECVVTGGEGTIEVTFEGKTYYVCCTGCRDYFNENPAEVLAEYRERKAAEQEEAAN